MSLKYVDIPDIREDIFDSTNRKKDMELKIVLSVLMRLSYQNVYFVMYMFR